jgi:hypothetical protein
VDRSRPQWTTDFVRTKLADTDGSHTFKALDDYLRLEGLA